LCSDPRVRFANSRAARLNPGGVFFLGDTESLTSPRFLAAPSFWLTLGSAATILLSIAVSQILLALAVGALLLSGLPLRLPRIALPLGLFLLWSLIALAFSPDPAFGLAQERKIFVYLTLLTVFSTVRAPSTAKWLVWSWMLLGTATALRGVGQFARDMAQAKAAHADQYHFYVADRIRGFMSHWMTFSGQEMFVLLLLIAWILFGNSEKRALWLWIPCLAITGAALEFAQTRSVWLAAVGGSLYLLWCRRKAAVALVPVALTIAILLGPQSVRTRVKSISSPETRIDSNEHRVICFRTGWRMIEAHPLFGVGPDEIQKESVFFAYLPPDVKRPLPDGYYGHLHNFYIQYAAERGIPATLLVVAALILALRDFRGALRSLPPENSIERFLLHAAVACTIGVMIGGVFEYNLNDTEVLTMFLAILSLGYLGVERTARAV
jgi:O-antigen ligase